MESMSKNQIFDLIKEFSDFFEIDFEIKVFGKSIIKYHYPPKKN